MVMSLGTLATSMAIQAAIKEITEYLESMDKKLDRLLMERRVEALAELGGISTAIDEAMTIYEQLGSVSSTTWSKVQANATDLHVVQALALEKLRTLADEVESTRPDSHGSVTWRHVCSRTLSSGWECWPRGSPCRTSCTCWRSAGYSPRPLARGRRIGWSPQLLRWHARPRPSREGPIARRGAAIAERAACCRGAPESTFKVTHPVTPQATRVVSAVTVRGPTVERHRRGVSDRASCFMRPVDAGGTHPVGPT